MQVIPAINAVSFDEIKEKIKQVEPYITPPGGAGWVQIDVADKTFTANLTWNKPKDLFGLNTNLNIEIHLMVENLEEKIDSWLIEPVKRIIFHLEAAKDPHLLIKKCKEAKKEVGVAIGPDCSWTELAIFCDKVDIFQILAVKPGLSGQEFKESNLGKIRLLRENCPNAILGVDGGINKEIAKKAKEAGADIVCAASYIFDSKDVKKAIEELTLV